MLTGKIALDGMPEYERDYLIDLTRKAVHDQVEFLYGKIPQVISSNRRHLMNLNISGDEVARVEYNLHAISYKVIHPETMMAA